MDAGSYRYWYREKYNLPRVTADHTDELTDYEYEYEFLQEVALRQIKEEITNKADINLGDDKFERQFSMDEDDYARIREAQENGEYVDFEIPADAPMGKRYSEVDKYIPPTTEPENEFVPVLDLSQEFRR